MSGFGKFDWDSWLYGMVAGFISGGAGAVVTGITVSGLDPNDFNFYTGRFYLLILVVFGANGILAAMAFLHQNPLPKVIVTTTETTEQKRTSPETTVTKKETIATTEQKQ